MEKYKYKLYSKKGQQNLKEKVVSTKVKKVYSVGEISKWIRFGIKNGYIDQNSKDIISWVKNLLSGKNVEL